MRNHLLFIVLFVIIKPDLIICNADTESNEEENLALPAETDATPEYVSTRTNCNSRKYNSIVHEVKDAQANEFPFIAAIYSQNEQFVCSGSVVGNGIILTAAECLQPPPIYVVLNADKDKGDNTTEYLQVTSIEFFMNQTGDKRKNVGLIHYKDKNKSSVSKLKVSNFTSFKEITEFEAIGYGLNADIGEVKHLQYVGLENKITPTKGEAIIGYLDCIDTKTPSCFKDIGGPALFGNEMIGIVIEGQISCTKEMTSKFAVDKFMVNVLPAYIFSNWLEENIARAEKHTRSSMVIYPVKPTSIVENKPINKKIRRSSGTSNIASPIVFASIFTSFSFI